MSIREAVWPADEAVACTLLREYAAYLASDPHGSAGIHIEGQELETLAHVWAPPRSILLLGFVDAQPMGCVGVRVTSRGSSASTCELKRLWVDARARGHGLGRRLVQSGIEWARSTGAGTVLLDTVPSAMPAAVELYRSLGFCRTKRYNDNRVPGIMFMKLKM